MRVLILHPDPSALQSLTSQLETQGHNIIAMPDVTGVPALLRDEPVHVIMIDRLMSPDMRAFIVQLRRQAIKGYPYTFLIGVHQTEKEAIAEGANQGLSLPVKGDALQKAMDDAMRLVERMNLLADAAEDFPSSGGVIAKSAFNQIFLSCLDRADRYGEPSFIIWLRLANYAELRALDGAHAADYAASTMARHIVRIRRQSDIIAQTGRQEYALLLMRPNDAREPVEAAGRYADTLSRCLDIAFSPLSEAQISIQVMTIPTGRVIANHHFSLKTAPA